MWYIATTGALMKKMILITATLMLTQMSSASSFNKLSGDDKQIASLYSGAAITGFASGMAPLASTSIAVEITMLSQIMFTEKPDEQVVKELEALNASQDDAAQFVAAEGNAETSASLQTSMSLIKNTKGFENLSDLELANLNILLTQTQ